MGKLPNGHKQRISGEILRCLGTARNKEGRGYQSRRGVTIVPSSLLLVQVMPASFVTDVVKYILAANFHEKDADA